MKEKANFPSSFFETIPWNGENVIWPSTLFVLRRNLSQYLFPSKMDQNTGAQLLSLLKNSLAPISDIKEPYFFSDSDLSPSDRELIYERFILPKPFQETSKGIGLMVDQLLSMIVILNRENHVEIYLIDPKNNLDTSWATISKIDTALNQTLNWAFSSRFGYLTSNPAECGTGLTAIAHLHIPAIIHMNQLTDLLGKQNEEEISAKSLVGNLEEIIGDILTIQNNYTLGVTEENILRLIQTSANKIASLEKTLRSHLKQELPPAIKDQISKAFGILFHSYQLEAKEALNLLSLLLLGLDLGLVSGVNERKMNELMFKCRRGYLSHLLPPPTDPKETSHQRAEFLHQQLKELSLKI
ncbi:MAG: protein arginine kinase [Chlamydiae bacterium]|nr:protein arginine kinase [Chlamydiota bacterium]